MRQRERLSWKDWVYFVACASLVLYLAWVVSSVQNGASSELRWTYRFVVVCQRVARVVGAWGMAAERHYHVLIEEERMN